MTGYAFCLKPGESSSLGWQYIDAHRDRLVKVDYEESSIDFGVTAAPRFVIDGIVHDVIHQYFESTGSSTNRILLLTPVFQENENGQYVKTQKLRPRSYTGSDSYTQRKMNEKQEDGGSGNGQGF